MGKCGNDCSVCEVCGGEVDESYEDMLCADKDCPYGEPFITDQSKPLNFHQKRPLSFCDFEPDEVIEDDNCEEDCGC